MNAYEILLSGWFLTRVPFIGEGVKKIDWSIFVSFVSAPIRPITVRETNKCFPECAA